MKKRIMIPILLLTVLVIVYAVSWTPHRPRSQWRSEAALLSLVDNITPKEQLITKSYKFNKQTDHLVWKPIWYLGSLYGWQQTILGTPYLNSFHLDDLSKFFEIECLRQPDPEHLYAIFRDKKGNYFYALFLYYKDSESSHWYVGQVWYPYKTIYKADYEALQIGVSTFDDVKKIDSYAKMFLYGGNFPPEDPQHAGHTKIADTWDGYTVKIFYSKEDKTVAEVRVTQNDEHSLHTYLLPMDLPE